VQCEVCEVDCPHGALTIVPNVSIDKQKCKHCHKCLESHDRGCIATDCIRMINDTDKKMAAKVQAYKTFGFREEWLTEYLFDPDEFWNANSLGTAQVDGFKAWLKDAEIVDAKNNLSAFGELLKEIVVDDPDLTWELIFVNLAYNSFIVGWFVNNIKSGQIFDKKSMTDAICESNTGAPVRTVENAVAALVQTFNYSPLGQSFGCCIEEGKNSYKREEYAGVSNIALAYSIYRFSESVGTKSLRVSDFYEETAENGAAKIFGLSRVNFEKGLRSLNSERNRVLIAELSMGLQHITLREDLSAESVVRNMLGI